MEEAVRREKVKDEMGDAEVANGRRASTSSLAPASCILCLRRRFRLSARARDSAFPLVPASHTYNGRQVAPILLNDQDAVYIRS